MVQPYLVGMLNQIASDNERAFTVKPGPLAYQLHEAAALLNISSSSVRRLVQRGRLRRVSGFRHLLIPASELEKLVNSVA
ncbi:MAG: DNA-binding protein [Acidobacteriia bacterium]|nr:DNA-binding protein [Terriglobia bacterium]